jgi:hypothetical protein
MKLHDRTPSPRESGGELRTVQVCYTAMEALNRLVGARLPQLAAWTNREMATCRRSVAVIVDRRLAAYLQCAAVPWPFSYQRCRRLPGSESGVRQFFIQPIVTREVRGKRQQTRALAVFLRVLSKARGMKIFVPGFGHSMTLRVALAVSLTRGLEGFSHHGSTRFKTHNRPASAAIAGGFVLTALSNARQRTLLPSYSSVEARLR